MTESGFDFVPPTTSPEYIDELAHLRADIQPGDAMHDLDPFELFSQIGQGLALESGITAEEMVVGMQIMSGRALNTQGLRNMLGWARETIDRQNHADGWDALSRTERINVIYGIEIDFGESDDEDERIAV